jgi:Holliday junction resolvase RusA-like endonuclease
MNFSVPLLPPSVNHYKQPRQGGGWFRAAEAIAFVDAVCIFSHRCKVTGSSYEIDLTFYLSPKRNRGQNDLDNYSKVALDSLVRAGVIVNDAHVFDLHLHKRFVATDREERTDFSVEGKQIDDERLGREAQRGQELH